MRAPLDTHRPPPFLRGSPATAGADTAGVEDTARRHGIGIVPGPGAARAALNVALAILAFLLAFGLRFALNRALPPGFPFLTFFPAVILVAFFLGTWPGIVCAVLSGVAAWYWFVPPVNALGFGAGAALAMGFYVFIVGVDIAIIAAIRRSQARLRVEKARSAALAERQRTLFAELQHRVANNLAFTATLLELQRGRMASDPCVGMAAFDAAVSRLHLMGRMHRRLHEPAALDQSLRDYLRALCTDLLEVTGAIGVDCRVEALDLRLGLDRLTTLSLLVTELMTNSVKHGFQGRGGGTLTVELRRIAVDRVMLTVSDDGPGMPSGPLAGGGLGLRIVESLADQLDGTLTLPGPGQSGTRVVFTA